MSKESIYELQKIDCNCNDCAFLSRSLEKQNSVLANDKVQQQSSFDLVKDRKMVEANKTIANLEKIRHLIDNVDEKINGKKRYLKTIQACKHSYQGQRTPIQYGECLKFKKEITFIANTVQPQTQHCFIHRKNFVPS